MPCQEMRRHKIPLDFAESPIEGVKHARSPVLAAGKPPMASYISADLISTQWVSV